MNTRNRHRFIAELTAKINEYVSNDDLFAGGCCYAAYVLAAALRAAGIRYKTVMFQYRDILRVNNFNDAINGRGISHVGIEVRIGNRPYIIGDCSGIYQYFDCTGENFKIRKYRGVRPKELLDGYKNNTWNNCYRTNMNKFLAIEIAHITKTYTGKRICLERPDPQAEIPRFDLSPRSVIFGGSYLFI